MKGSVIGVFVVLLLMVTILNTQVYGQSLDKSDADMLAGKIVESINGQSIDALTPFISEDFELSGRPMPLSLKILEQLVVQLNEEVSAYTWVKSEADDKGDSLYVYSFDYKLLGKRDVSFSVNELGKIHTLELVKIKVKTLEGKSAVSLPEEKIIEIPFRLQGNMILIDAFVNGSKGTFIFDSGSPRLILNQQHFGTKNSEEDVADRFSSLEGIHGNINNLDIITLDTFNFFGIKMAKQRVLTAELSSLASALEMPIAGLIGYEVFKGFDVLYDYERQKLSLIKAEKLPQYLVDLSANYRLSELAFVLKGHLPILSITVSDHKLMVGLDCGASTNLISENYYTMIKDMVSNMHESDLYGAQEGAERVKKGLLEEMLLGKIRLKNVPTVFKDISHLQKAYWEKMDGLIGFELLSKQLTLVSYSQGKLYFFD